MYAREQMLTFVNMYMNNSLGTLNISDSLVVILLVIAVQDFKDG